MVKRLLAFGPATAVLLMGLWIGPKFDRFVLPAFDGHVYDAMAESPRFFTLAPWGYRTLAPWLVHFLPAPSFAEGFFWLTVVSLATAVWAAGSWLRRLGFGEGAAALGSLTLALSPPVRQMLEYQVLVDPLTLLLYVLILRELTQPRTLVLMALFAMSALSKETGLLALALVPLSLVLRDGWTRGLLKTTAIALPAAGLAFYLRFSWGDANPHTPFSSTSLLARLGEARGDLAVAALLSGLTLLAAIGLFREKSWTLRAAGVLMWFLTLASIAANPYGMSTSDLPRLVAFAWPALIPLALSGVGLARPATPAVDRGPSAISTTLSLLALAACVAVVTATDPYKRTAFETNPNPVAVTGRLRESIKTARAFAEGTTFAFDSASGRFAEPVAERFNLTEGRRQRWFLYNGFAPDAAFGEGAPEFRHNAELILPILEPRDLTMTFEVSGAGYVPVFISHRQIGEVFAGKGPKTVDLAASDLVRGDNIIRLETYTEDAMRLVRWEVAPRKP